MTRLIHAELFKLRKRAMTKVLLFVLMGILVIMYLIFLAISRISLPAGTGSQIPTNIQNIFGLPVAIPLALSMLASLGTVLAVILTASSMGNEYNWRTIRTALIISESRFKLLGAKLISVIIVILLGMVIIVATGFVMSLITTAIGRYAFDFSFATGSYIWNQFLQFWRVFYVMLPYISLGFLLSIVGRSAIPGIAIGIAVLIFEPIITGFMRLAGGLIAVIPDFLLARNVNSLTALADLPLWFGSSGDTPSVVHATVVLAVYSAVFIILAFYLFHRRDVTGSTR